MRGYSPSGYAIDGRYDVGALAEDAINLIEALARAMQSSSVTTGVRSHRTRRQHRRRNGCAN
ncbi:MAG TPA: hypothetical protein VN867_01385 [Candidatus Binataceae bacterium]|nr:hypothetical protein [Candidatus Binataceae bacterium]